MNINPSAALFWAIFSAIGYVVDDVNGALIGFAASASLSLTISILGQIFRK